MKKKLTLLLCLLLVACMATGCAYLPFAGYSNMLNVGSSTTATTDGDTVTLSKAEYVR